MDTDELKTPKRLDEAVRLRRLFVFCMMLLGAPGCRIRSRRRVLRLILDRIINSWSWFVFWRRVIGMHRHSKMREYEHLDLTCWVFFP